MKLNDVFTGWYDEGAIFAQLKYAASTAFPWASATNDIEYFGNHSGMKEISPLLENTLIKYNTSTINYNSPAMNKLASIVIGRYGDKWKRLYDAINEQYEILSTSEKIEETPNITKTNNITTNATETPNTTTATLNKTTTNIEEYSDGSSTGDIYGFNSTSPVPQSDSAANSTRRTIADGENNKTDQNRTETGTRQNVEESSSTELETGKRTTVRTGNNGRTNQSMLKEELELREWEFLKIVYADMDTLMTCPKY